MLFMYEAAIPQSGLNFNLNYTKIIRSMDSYELLETEFRI